MRKPSREGDPGTAAEPDNGQPDSQIPSHVSSQVELGQLLAVIELFATVQKLTRHQAEEIQSLSSWVHGWQERDEADLQPATLQFIRECTSECLCRSSGVGLLVALTKPRGARARLH